MTVNTKIAEGEMTRYIILHALARAPKKTREVCHTTGLSIRCVAPVLKEMGEQGWVVKDINRRWHAKVKLAVVKTEEMALEASVSLAGGPEQAPMALGPTKPHLAVPGANEAAAAHFQVPAKLNLGPLQIGPPKQCKECQRLTPLLYGGQPVCVNCARMWRD